MALTDPELDLLREMLEDDPSDDAFLQVGEELVRRFRWAEAEEVLARGLAHAPDSGGFALLARAALETGRFDLAGSALERIDCDPARSPENARVRILVLERSGRTGDARREALRFLELDRSDVVVSAVVERLDAPPPPSSGRGKDPFYTVERAERYVKIGRPDRAIRVYRRIARGRPGDPAYAMRLAQLSAQPLDAPDDLSEDLTDPGLVPEAPDPPEASPAAPEPIAMPAPRLSGPPASNPDEEDTDLTLQPQVRALPEVDPDDETTSGPIPIENLKARQRRRRRSLIRR